MGIIPRRHGDRAAEPAPRAAGLRCRQIGPLEVGRGSLYWYGRNRKKRERVDWSRFAEMMDKLAYSA